MTTNAPYWAAALYGLLAASAIVLGGRLVGPSSRLGVGPDGLLVSISAGFLLALGLLGALPEALEHATTASVPLAIAAVSFCVMLLVHRLGHAAVHADGHSKHDPHHEHDDAHAARSHAAPASAENAHATPAHVAHTHADPALSLHDARLAVAGLALHSLLDGVAVGAAFASRRELGLFVAGCVLLHKLPEGATAAALTYAGGGETKGAWRAVSIVAAASLAGALAIFAVGPVLGIALAITAGVTSGVGVGIATHLLSHRPSRALLGMITGAAVFAASEFFLR